MGCLVCGLGVAGVVVDGFGAEFRWRLEVRRGVPTVADAGSCIGLALSPAAVLGAEIVADEQTKFKGLAM